ncbi:Putative anti-sigma factor antagonist [Defluviimonas aquaemixtae]|uniref:Anti-sigma factor antagonist n=1 Tax=Albidovulum aquaemixtae TaxID=1542388 RepID=A0A2R8BL74_9RHOB|nr:STAS domain-containing protein [Defluviimonas aquaemixtae]SPH24138.1 Putative anti-sigma factor antagonist [Defluviimonas aquaemixtae]
MNLISEPMADALVVRVHEDRIDAAVAIQFKDRMREMAAEPSGRVILDLSRVNFVDSSGLGAIVSVMKFLAPAATLELAALTPNVGKVFRLTRMDSVFPIHDAAPASAQDPGNGG